jgi:hypothetical protein
MRRRHAAELDDLVRRAVREAGGNRTRAARLLGMDRAALLRRIAEHGLEVPPTCRGRRADLEGAMGETILVQLASGRVVRGRAIGCAGDAVAVSWAGLEREGRPLTAEDVAHLEAEARARAAPAEPGEAAPESTPAGPVFRRSGAWASGPLDDGRG